MPISKDTITTGIGIDQISSVPRVWVEYATTAHAIHAITARMTIVITPMASGYGYGVGRACEAAVVLLWPGWTLWLSPSGLLSACTLGCRTTQLASATAQATTIACDMSQA
jgi:hypothetical protein